MNWKQIISDIIDSGLSEQEIAAIVGTTQPTINRIKTGVVNQPKYEMGVALVALHKKHGRKAA